MLDRAVEDYTRLFHKKPIVAATFEMSESSDYRDIWKDRFVTSDHS